MCCNGEIMGLKNFIKNCTRVLKVTRRPTREEYLAASKITGLGIILIGIIGFVIFLIFHFVGIFG
ncbi:MAG: protein translocase SEC61 complex subunit gamma [Candidatus Aenigmarchaeota archaeon]|nr:protein translocase SEC61 complex subunit gamma [Candidatus Aenigmarchaeota archaeon]